MMLSRFRRGDSDVLFVFAARPSGELLNQSEARVIDRDSAFERKPALDLIRGIPVCAKKRIKQECLRHTEIRSPILIESQSKASSAQL
jgi:hypothetical protein